MSPLCSLLADGQQSDESFDFAGLPTRGTNTQDGRRVRIREEQEDEGGSGQTPEGGALNPADATARREREGETLSLSLSPSLSTI